MMRFGVCRGWNASDADTARREADLLAEVGYDFVEGNLQGLLVPEQDEEAFGANLELIESLPLPLQAVNCFFPGEIKLVGPELDKPRMDAWVRTALKRAERMGVRIVVLGSGTARTVPEGFDPKEAFEQLASHLVRWGPIAQATGVVIAIEPLAKKHSCNFITSVFQGSDLVEKVGHKHVQLLADSWHMESDGEPFEHLEKVGRHLVHIHLAELDDRAAPGTKDEDFRPFFAELKKVGYRGRISIEASWKDFETQAAVALSTLRTHWEDA